MKYAKYILRLINSIFIVLIINTIFPFTAFAQTDTIKMMQYNLMYYTDNSGVSDCNSTTNSLNTKDAALRTILQYVQPDVFCVCEMGSNISYVNRLMDSDLNINGVDYYQHCPLTNYSGGYIANMMYYDSRKMSFYKSFYLTTSYRDINGYRMFFNTPNLSSGDTIFMTFWITHLKAGSTADNEASRLDEVQRLMNRIITESPGNCTFSGDFNLYGAEETAYQELINYSNSLYRFYDPINQAGHWNNNSQFAAYHTQSTHSQYTDCFSSGGMDDRFDFILVSPYVYYGSKKVQVVPNSYHALGQDGNRFNGSIISPTNNSIPSAVATALYNQSDHLPVITNFAIDTRTGIPDYANNLLLQVTNPVRDELVSEIQVSESDTYNFDIFSIDGKKLGAYSQYLEQGTHRLNYPFPYSKGIYLLKVSNLKHQQIVKKLVK